MYDTVKTWQTLEKSCEDLKLLRYLISPSLRHEKQRTFLFIRLDLLNRTDPDETVRKVEYILVICIRTCVCVCVCVGLFTCVCVCVFINIETFTTREPDLRYIEDVSVFVCVCVCVCMIIKSLTMKNVSNTRYATSVRDLKICMWL